MKKLKHFWKEDTGASSIEYILIAVLVAVALVVVMGKFGPDLKSVFKVPSEQHEAVERAPSP